MKRTQDYKNNQKEKVDLKAWMLEHSREYGKFVADMGEADLFGVFMMGQAAFLASPEFQKRLENMIDLDNLDIDELVNILGKSNFAEATLTNPYNNKRWERFRLPLAAWLKHGRSSETVVENIEKAITLSGNQQAKWQLSKFLTKFMKIVVESGHRTTEELKEYLEYRKAVDNDKIAEWAFNCMENEAESTSFKTPITAIPVNCDLASLLASHDAAMVSRIGEWIKFHPQGIDMAYLFISLIEVGEIEPDSQVTRFMRAIKLSFPSCKIVGARQVQKDVNTLQSLSPNRKRYGKEEPEHRAVIDIIKTSILKRSLENID